MLENKNISYILNSSSPDPYVRDVLIPNYSVAEDYFAITHPSLPNYIAITAGSTLKVKNNTIAEGSLNDTNLVDLLTEHNLTWKAYMQSMPTSNTLWCSNGFYNSNDPGNGPGYVTKLDPFIFFSDIFNNYSRCGRIVPLTQFNEDLENNQLPRFSFITPNVTNNGHTVPINNVTTCPPSGTRLQCTDNWLKGFMQSIMKSKEFATTVVFIVWDAAKPNNASNHVVTIVVSPYTKRGFVENTTFYTHYSVLATIEKIYSLGSLGRNDSTANVLDDMFIGNTTPT
jgi:acid phosphatase